MLNVLDFAKIMKNNKKQFFPKNGSTGCRKFIKHILIFTHIETMEDPERRPGRGEYKSYFVLYKFYYLLLVYTTVKIQSAYITADPLHIIHGRLMV